MIFFLHDVKQFSLDRFIFKMGGLLSFILQKHFSILVLKYKKIQRGGGMNDFSQKQFSHHTVTHFNTDPPCLDTVPLSIQSGQSP